MWEDLFGGVAVTFWFSAAKGDGFDIQKSSLGFRKVCCHNVDKFLAVHIVLNPCEGGLSAINTSGEGSRLV